MAAAARRKSIPKTTGAFQPNRPYFSSPQHHPCFLQRIDRPAGKRANTVQHLTSPAQTASTIWSFWMDDWVLRMPWSGAQTTIWEPLVTRNGWSRTGWAATRRGPCRASFLAAITACYRGPPGAVGPLCHVESFVGDDSPSRRHGGLFGRPGSPGRSLGSERRQILSGISPRERPPGLAF